MNGSLAKSDLQLKASYGSLPPCSSMSYAAAAAGTFMLAAHQVDQYIYVCINISVCIHIYWYIT